MKQLLTLFAVLSSLAVAAQPEPSLASSRIQNAMNRATLDEKSLLNNIPFIQMGPTVMSGRVSDLEVDPKDATHFYVSYASGGLWETKNNGASFEPIFDHEETMTIGDFDVHWQTGQIMIGTGEVNSSRSSYAGIGMYHSLDNGKNWQHRGLEETHHIGKVLFDKRDPNVVLVAALGHLYSKNTERGLFLTQDGGKTWKHTLALGDSIGGIELVRDPLDVNICYAATWERHRSAWNFKEAGEGSNIYRSNDGGLSWQLMTGDASGFKMGKGKGRIGLSATGSGGKTVLFAVMDSQDDRPKASIKVEKQGITPRELRALSSEAFLAMDTTKLAEYLRTYRYPRKYGTKQVRERVRNGELTPASIADFVGDANSALFDTEVEGPLVYRSDDKGVSWRRVNDKYIDDCFNTYGYYFAQIRVGTMNPDRLYIMGVPILTSADGGKTWESIDGDNGHADHHCLWINPDNPNHLINGNDGGILITYDHGKHWTKCNSPAVGQCYAVAVDEAIPYRVYCGLQDNGVWFGEYYSPINTEWHATGHNAFKELMGGDGMQIAIDPRDNNTLYTGYQFGNYYKMLRTGSRQTPIQPKHELGDAPYRWNWQSPIMISTHQPDVLYFGGNKLFRSLDQGKTMLPISPDLTHGKREGDVPFGTISSIDESPKTFGLLVVGTDDGRVHVSENSGFSWSDISAGLPTGLWVSRVVASAHDRKRLYVSLNGYRNDHFDSYVYRSDNLGVTWRRICIDLPAQPVNVVLEDPDQSKMLYIGTDQGLYASLDGGLTAMPMQNSSLPRVAVHDLAIQRTEKHLIVGTHGRSMFRTDLQYVQQLDSAVLASKLHVFSPPKLTFNESWGDRPWTWAPIDTPDTKLAVYTSTGGAARLTIMGADGRTLGVQTMTLPRGLSYPKFLPVVDAKSKKIWQSLAGENAAEPKNGLLYLPPGKYQIALSLEGGTAVSTFWEVVEEE
jgi:photosystem II stability/assembly factor-like uncharacterized protein